jgi:hypothetical protein
MKNIVVNYLAESDDLDDLDDPDMIRDITGEPNAIELKPDTREALKGDRLGTIIKRDVDELGSEWFLVRLDASNVTQWFIRQQIFREFYR